MNEHLAAMGVGLGDRYIIGVFDPAQEDAVHSDTPPPPVDVHPLLHACDGDRAMGAGPRT